MIEVGSSIRVLLADDHAIVRNGVAQILNEEQGIDVVAQAADGAEAVELFAHIRPDVALVDLRMPKLEGVQVVEQIRDRFPDAAIVILTTYDTDNDIERALRAGAKAFLVKDVSPRDLVACVRAVHSGRTWVSPRVAAKLVAHVTNVRLTRRELAVLRSLAAGNSNREIGDLLGISDGTVKIHLTHLFAKLDVTSRTEAIATALRRGLVRID
ncbi:MAG TPA: response regulator transcription factor [Gemmatimonadaceae bacterium]|jgi:two-component system NarL family response regulator|nr:response regulator transcription factor [Gemmatimonadaceae bacterium]